MAARNTDYIKMVLSQDKTTAGTVRYLETTRNGKKLMQDDRPHQFYLLKQQWRELGEPETITIDISSP